MITAELPLRAMPVLPPPAKRAFVEHIMGMPISVHVRAIEVTRPDIAAGVQRVFHHLRAVDAVLSTWRADSDLLRLQHGELDPSADSSSRAEEPHPWLAEVSELCLLAEERTDGLFGAWYRGRERRNVFDPTGLVKGWAVGHAAEHLALVPEIAWSINAGGDVITGAGSGMRGLEPRWRIGVEDPHERGHLVEVVDLTRGAVATSGTAARGAHVVDPRTGRPRTAPGSATVVGPELLWADIWATAAFVDPERARVLMAQRDPDYRLSVH